MAGGCLPLAAAAVVFLGLFHTPGPVTAQTTLLPRYASWKYNDTVAFADSSWAAPAFVDTTWASGACSWPNGIFAESCQLPAASPAPRPAPTQRALPMGLWGGTRGEVPGSACWMRVVCTTRLDLVVNCCCVANRAHPHLRSHSHGLWRRGGPALQYHPVPCHQTSHCVRSPPPPPLPALSAHRVALRPSGTVCFCVA